MEDEKNKVIDVFNSFISKVKIDINNVNDEDIIIKQLNKDNYRNQISNIDYYSKRYLRSNKEIFKNKYEGKFDLAYLTHKYEDMLFRSLLGIENKEFYHYTSFSSFIKILKTNKIRLSSIAGLNDKYEMNYFDSEVDHDIKDEYHYKRIEAFNNRFLLSCSYLKDDLNQWRLYGDDGKGVSIEFEVIKENQSEDFYIGKILYGGGVIRQLNQLIDDLYKEYNLAFVFNRFLIWKHFFKSQDWDYEKEIRLIKWSKAIDNDQKDSEWDINRYGILAKYKYIELEKMPIRIKGVVLGPKLVENELNKAQLKQYLRERNDRELINKIYFSRILCYR